MRSKFIGVKNEVVYKRGHKLQRVINKGPKTTPFKPVPKTRVFIAYPKTVTFLEVINLYPPIKQLVYKQRHNL